MVAVAELEAGLVSERTKAALAAAKRRGTKLGNPNLAKASASALASIRRNADVFAKQVLPVIRDVQQSGAGSLRAIARALETRGVPTARGGQSTPVQVRALLRRNGLRSQQTQVG
jgi:DNA invertase Pin-like site-specific DNA recombinase